jgi:hypothetical protein
VLHPVRSSRGERGTSRCARACALRRGARFTSAGPFLSAKVTLLSSPRIYLVPGPHMACVCHFPAEKGTRPWYQPVKFMQGTNFHGRNGASVVVKSIYQETDREPRGRSCSGTKICASLSIVLANASHTRAATRVRKAYRPSTRARALR